MQLNAIQFRIEHVGMTGKCGKGEVNTKESRHLIHPHLFLTHPGKDKKRVLNKDREARAEEER